MRLSGSGVVGMPAFSFAIYAFALAKPQAAEKKTAQLIRARRLRDRVAPQLIRRQSGATSHECFNKPPQRGSSVTASRTDNISNFFCCRLRLRGSGVVGMPAFSFAIYAFALAKPQAAEKKTAQLIRARAAGPQPFQGGSARRVATRRIACRFERPSNAGAFKAGMRY